MAISKALCFIEVGPEVSHLILTDSLSSLLALRSFYPKHPFAQDILSRLKSLQQAGKSVQFCWIPSHVGIAGNELADAAARRAASVPCTRRLPLPARDFYPAASRLVHSLWQNLWDTRPSNKLRNIKPVLEPWLSSSRSSRRQEVILSRLRIGHTMERTGTFSAEKTDRCARTVTSQFQLLTSCWYAGDMLANVGVILGTFHLRSHLSISLVMIPAGSGTVACSPLSVTLTSR